MNKIDKSMSKNGEEKRTVGERSTMTIGLVIVISGWIGWSAWWASRITTKLDYLIENQTVNVTALSTLRTRVEQLERTSDMFSQVGSPVLRSRLEAVEKSIDHINLTGSPKVTEMERNIEQLTRRVEVFIAEQNKAKP